MWGDRMVDRFCGYACMARCATSDTEVHEDHAFDGEHCQCCGAVLSRDEEPAPV